MTHGSVIPWSEMQNKQVNKSSFIFDTLASITNVAQSYILSIHFMPMLLKVNTTLDHKQPFHCVHLPSSAAKSPSGIIYLQEIDAYHPYVLDYTIEDTMVVPNWLFEEMNFAEIAQNRNS